MTPQARDYLLQSLQTPSPSGYEESIQSINRRYVESVADEIRIDVHGNLIAEARRGAGSNPARSDDAGTSESTDAESADVAGPASDGPAGRTTPRLMFAGHCDQIGMLVSHIDDNGYVYAQTIGGWDPQQLIGQAMSIWVGDDTSPLGVREVPAVISRKPIHLLNAREREQVVKLDELWLDMGAADGDQAKSMVSIGDPITLQLNHRPLAGNLISGPGMDNKSGMWTVLEAFRRAASDPQSLAWDLFSVATVQEEIGLRGAKTAAGSVNPDVAIAVDVTHASDCPKIDKTVRGDITVGGGPVIFRGPNINRKIARRLETVAAEHQIPVQFAAVGRATPNDANALQIHGSGVAVGLVAIPNRYMHSAVEVISTDDIDHAAELLARFALSLADDDQFHPGL